MIGDLTAPAALADTAAVSSKAELAASLRSASPGSTTEVGLGQDLTAVDGANDALSTPDGSIVTLDLHGRQLVLQRLTLGTGAELDVTDSTGTTGLLQVGAPTGSTSDDTTGIAIGSGARLRVSGTRIVAYGSDIGATAGIGSPGDVITDPGSLWLTDRASVTGQGGKGGAGIGGAAGAAAISVSMVDSRLVGRGGLGGAGIGSGRSGRSFSGLTSTTTVTQPQDAGDYSRYASSIDGAGGRGAAGIGGGLHASGGVVRLDGNTDANASSSGPVTSAAGSPSALGAGQAPLATTGTFGSLRVGRHAWLWANNPRDSLLVPADAVVQNDGSIRALGGVTGDGMIVNHGLVSSSSSSSPISPETDPGARIGVKVTGHDYLVALHANGGTISGRSAVRVYCAYLDTGFLPSATAPRSDRSLMGWNTRADGSGDDLSGQSLEDLTGDESADGAPIVLDLYARFGATPRFTATTMPTAGLNRPYAQPLPVSGDGISGYRISDRDEDGAVIPGLPAGLTLDTASGRITGTPVESGSFRFRVVSSGMYPVDGFVTMTVAGPPSIASVALPSGSRGAAYSAALAATGGGGPVWSLRDGALPQGLSLSPDGLLSGTPNTSAVSEFTLQVSNEAGTASRSFTLNVDQQPAAPSPVATPSPTATPSPVTTPSPAAPPSSTATPHPTVTPSPTASSPASAASSDPSADEPDPSVAAPIVTDAPTAGAPTAGAPASMAAPTLPNSGSTTIDDAPALIEPTRIHALIGHRVAMSLGASRTASTTYSFTGALPSGVALDARTGLLRGVPAESGTFAATVTATNEGGMASTRITVVVPAPQELIDVEHAPKTWAGSRPMPISIRGLVKGERFRVALDGRVVRTGKVGRSGIVTTSIPVRRPKSDVVHRVEISTDRVITDPATISRTSFRFTALAAKRALRVVSRHEGGVRTVVVQRLAAGERVVLEVKGRVVSRGRADRHGEYAFARSTKASDRVLIAIGAIRGRRGGLDAAAAE